MLAPALTASVVLCAFVAMIYFLARWQRTRLAADRTGLLAVEARLALTPEQQIYVVRVGARTLVLGGTATQLALLTELDTAEAGPVDPARVAARREWWPALRAAQSAAASRVSDAAPAHADVTQSQDAPDVA